MHAQPVEEGVVQKYRFYSESETRWMCGLLFSSCAVSIVMHACFPTRDVDKSVASEHPHERLSLKRQVVAISSVLVNPYIIMFIPRFLNHGLFLSFFTNVYPTSLQYATILANKHPYLTAYYAFSMCAGTAVSGLIVTPLNRRFHDFGLRPLYYITIGVQLLTYTIATLTVPNWSTAKPTSDGAFIEPSIIWVCLVAFLLGFGDSTNTSSNTVICSRLLPGRASHTYSAARFYIGATASVIFFCSPWLSMRAHAAILTATAVISGISFNFAVRKVEKRDENKENETSIASEETVKEI
ncbi:hypothetical protein PMAYCL1PPCAC_10052, partial [Pristionchus mayeri]